MSSTKPEAITSAGQNGEADLFLLSLKLNSSGRTNVLEWAEQARFSPQSKTWIRSECLVCDFQELFNPGARSRFQWRGHARMDWRAVGDLAS